MNHRVESGAVERLLNLVPFGLGHTKPKHFRDMFRIAWRNRDNAGYAWKVLSRGVCDGCALGVAGLHDWTIDGIHLCMTRLNLLRLNTMPAFDLSELVDLESLRKRLADSQKPVPGRCRPDPSGRGGLGWDNSQLRELGRLAHPMLRRKGDAGFRRISWDEANALLGRRLREAPPRRTAFFVTARGVTNEVYYVSQKVARFLGTNHVDNAARLCHAPSTGAMKHALGYAASTCSYSDWYGTDLVVFFGSNPANDQPVTTKYLHEARAKGTRIVMVNPYLEPGMKRYWVPSSTRSALFGTGLADWWFPVTQGGDTAFIYGVLKCLISDGGLNEAFIRDYTSGWEELRAECDRHRMEDLEQASGLPRSSMKEFADLLRGARNAVFVWSMGITQHATGGDGVSMVLNLGLARGYVGRPKNGLMPIRGHSSVQGGAEMGCYSTALPGGREVNPENCAALSQAYGFPVPEWPGMNAVEMVAACGSGALDVLYCVGGNFLRTLPDPDAVARAMAQVPFRVHQDILLTDQMFIEPEGEVLLLPAKTRYEQDGGGIETTTERRVAFTPEIPRQVGEARAEWRILRDAAAAAWPERAGRLGCESGPAIRSEIARVVPFYAGCERLEKTGDAIQWGGSRLCDDGRFGTRDGRAHFKTIALPSARPGAGSRADADPGIGETFVVSTRRGKQFNTLIYDTVDPLTGARRNAVFIHPEDASRLGFSGGDPIRLVNGVGHYDGVVFPVPIAPGNLQVHWPEGNVLIASGTVDPNSGVPDYNAVVRIERP